MHRCYKYSCNCLSEIGIQNNLIFLNEGLQLLIFFGDYLYRFLESRGKYNLCQLKIAISIYIQLNTKIIKTLNIESRTKSYEYA